MTDDPIRVPCAPTPGATARPCCTPPQSCSPTWARTCRSRPSPAGAGVGIGTLYRNFPTRDSLVEAAYRTEVAHLCDAAEELLATHPPDVALAAWMDRFVDLRGGQERHGRRAEGGQRRRLGRLRRDARADHRARSPPAGGRAWRPGRAARRRDADDVWRAMGPVWSTDDPEQIRTLLRLLMDGLRHTAADVTRPDHRLGDEGGAHAGALQRPGLDLRAQARRHPLHRDPRRRRRAAALAQRPAAQRPLPGRRRRPRGGRLHALRDRRRGRRLRGHPDLLPGLGRKDASIFYYVFDILWLDGEDVRDLPAARAQGPAQGCSDFENPRPAHGPPQRGGRGDVRRGVRQRLGGRDRQARRQHLHRQALARLAQVQVRAGPGARDRRLHRPARLARASSARCSSATTPPTASCATRARSAPASTARRSQDLGARMRALRRDSTPFADRPTTATRPGSSRSSSRQFGFAEWTTRRPPAPPEVPRPAHDKAAPDVVREAP